MDTTLKDLLQINHDSYMQYSFYKGKKNIKLQSNSNSIEIRKVVHYTNSVLDPDRESISIPIKIEDGRLKEVIQIIKTIPQRVLSIEYSENILAKIIAAFQLKSIFDDLILDDKEVNKKLGSALIKSTELFSKLKLIFNYNNAEVFQIPVDLFKASHNNRGEEYEKMYAQSESDWNLLLQKTLTEKSLGLLLPFDNENISLTEISGRKHNTCIISAKNRSAELSFIKELVNEKCEVYFRINRNNESTDWVKIEKAENDFLARISGIYFKKSKSVSAFIEKNSKNDDLKILQNFQIDPTNKISNKTHTIPSNYNNGKSRIDLHIDSQELEKIAGDTSFTEFPLVELKTRSYNYYCDIDLDWSLFKSSKAIHEFKRLQFEYFSGNETGFEPIKNALKNIYPYNKVDENVKVSSRAPETNKSGYHLIFKHLFLKNDGIQGLFLTGMLEKLFAKSLLSKTENPAHRFLLQAIYDDVNPLSISIHPIQFLITESFINSFEIEINIEAFIHLASSEIKIFLRSGKQTISNKDSTEIVGFVLNSIGKETIDEFFERYNSVKNSAFRFKIVSKLARRIRWELMRKLNFFDHSVYRREMGLRMLGNYKPEDENSRYASQTKDSKTKSILEHSIRTSQKTSSMPASFHYNYLHEIEKRHIRIRSLRGLFTKEKILKTTSSDDINLEFKVEKWKNRDLIQLKDKNNHGKKIKADEIVLSGNKQSIIPSSPLLISYKGKKLLVYPPKIRKKEKVLNRHKLLFNYVTYQSIAEFRVRAFIPAAIVAGPFTRDFGGDNRIPSYDEGTSRVDIDVTVDTITGVIGSKQAHWGTSHGYDKDDTSPVAGKPDWWRSVNPGAQPVASDTLQVVWNDNVSVSSGVNENGNNVLIISYSGVLPLEPTAPAIDGKFTIEFDHSTGTLNIEGLHDGFPQHTLYYNGNLVYNYDPIEEEGDPNNLFPPSDITKRVSPVMEYPSQDPSGQPGGNEDMSVPADEESEYDYETNDHEGGASWEEEVEFTQNEDDSITMSVGENSDTLYYDDEEGTWESDNGTCIEGNEDSFDDISEVSIGASEGKDGDATLYMELNGERFRLEPEDVYFN